MNRSAPRRPRWDPQQAGTTALDQLVYRSQLLGSDPSVVNWKGGNTSAKTVETDHAGRSIRVLWVKGSGSDLATIRREEFVGLRLDEVLVLRDRQELTDEEMVEHLARCQLHPAMPRPSVETLLHAFVPFAHVDHTHPDGVLVFCTAASGEDLTREVFGDRVIWIPYRRPGFALAGPVAAAVTTRPQAEAVFLARHGLVTWGETARACYDNTLRIIEEAEDALARRSAGRQVFGPLRVTPPDPARRRAVLTEVLPPLRGILSRHQRKVLHVDDAPDLLEFVSSARAEALSQVGSACPDHLVHTGHRPLFVSWDPEREGPESVRQRLLDGCARFAEAYVRYVEAHRGRREVDVDPAPRIVLIPGVGVVAAGRDKASAVQAAGLYRRAVAVMRGAEALSRFESLSDRDAFDVEYWPLELYKLTLAPPERELSRRVALITGAAGGIGRAIAARLVEEGAHVVLLDIDLDGARAVEADLAGRFGDGRALAVRCDVTDEQAVAAAFAEAVETYGGVDIVVCNAGVALAASVESTGVDQWRRLFEVLATGYFLTAREAVRVMKAQRLGGSIIFVVSKNALVPSRDSSAYNAAKAAELHLARTIAEEAGPWGIRVNSVCPDAVLEGSRIWTTQWRQERARAYGIPPERLEEYYRQRTTLKVNVYPRDVAEAVLFFASDRSSKTTGGVLTVDGGIPGAYVR
ncbi:MAG: bifunctional aldolase/short-chain dehydrogenase [Armatimonadota bacterium]|nr:bifunctional aldolase/short-chain dehydrogenase [Armatimonadota bacterium]